MIDSGEGFELIRGSGNVFRDLGRLDADLWRLKSILAAEILGVLDDRGLTAAEAAAVTSTPSGKLVGIRRGKLANVDVDCMMRVLARLDRRVRVDVTVEAHSGPTGDRAA